MSATGARLEFWYEFASTHPYLSAMRTEALAAAAGVDVAWKPFLIGDELFWGDDRLEQALAWAGRA